MKHKSSFTKRTIASILIFIMATVVLLGGSFAIYTSQVYQRSVVRNRNADVIRFSSDKLYRVAIDTPLQSYYYPMSKDQKVMSFTICNYDQNKNTLVCEKDINYVITFSIPEGTDKFSYNVRYGSNDVNPSNSGEVTLNNGKLIGGVRSTASYTIELPDEISYENVKISVVVKPITADMPLTKNTCLQAILVPVEYATVQGVNLKGEFTDSTHGKPDVFDAYNYSVSLSGGAEDVIIGWKADELDIDPFFLAKGTLLENANGYKRLKISMNSEDSTGDYLIQFYNHAGHTASWEAWSELPVYARLLSEESN